MRKRALQLACILGFMLVMLPAQVVRAHEHITIGNYEVVIGWLEEPPVAGQKNAVVLSITEQSSGTGLPAEDTASLEMMVAYGGQSRVLSLEPLGEDAPGRFMAPLVPTVPGEYTIILGGQLGDTAVDAQVHIEEVQPAETLQFPVPDTSVPTASPAWSLWLSLLAVVLGLAGIVLGVTAHRRTR